MEQEARSPGSSRLCVCVANFMSNAAHVPGRPCSRLVADYFLFLPIPSMRSIASVAVRRLVVSVGEHSKHGVRRGPQRDKQASSSTIPGTWLDTVLSIPHGRAFPSLSLLLGFGISVNEHLNLLPGHFGGDKAKIEGAQSMPVRRPRKTHYVGYVPSLAPSAIPISDLEFPSWEGNARSPHST